MTDLEPPRVRVILYLGFDDESEKALRIAWEAAQEILEEYGVWVEVIPVHIWIHDPTGIQVSDLPRIEVNGKVTWIGRAPDKEEFIDTVLTKAYSGEKPAEELTIPAAIIKHKDFKEAVLLDI